MNLQIVGTYDIGGDGNRSAGDMVQVSYNGTTWYNTGTVAGTGTFGYVDFDADIADEAPVYFRVSTTNYGIITTNQTLSAQGVEVDGQLSIDLSFVYDAPIYGCTDPNASNYDSEATVDDGSCDTDGDGVPDIDEVEGCTDSNALNYNPSATEDDGSCNYGSAPVIQSSPTDVSVDVVENVTSYNFNQSIQWLITDADNVPFASNDYPYEIFLNDSSLTTGNVPNDGVVTYTVGELNAGGVGTTVNYDYRIEVFDPQGNQAVIYQVDNNGDGFNDVSDTVRFSITRGASQAPEIDSAPDENLDYVVNYNAPSGTTNDETIDLQWEVSDPNGGNINWEFFNSADILNPLDSGTVASGGTITATIPTEELSPLGNPGINDEVTTIFKLFLTDTYDTNLITEDTINYTIKRDDNAPPQVMILDQTNGEEYDSDDDATEYDLTYDASPPTVELQAFYLDPDADEVASTAFWTDADGTTYTATNNGTREFTLSDGSNQISLTVVSDEDTAYEQTETINITYKVNRVSNTDPTLSIADFVGTYTTDTTFPVTIDYDATQYSTTLTPTATRSVTSDDNIALVTRYRINGPSDSDYGDERIFTSDVGIDFTLDSGTTLIEFTVIEDDGTDYASTKTITLTYNISAGDVPSSDYPEFVTIPNDFSVQVDHDGTPGGNYTSSITKDFVINDVNDGQSIEWKLYKVVDDPPDPVIDSGTITSNGSNLTIEGVEFNPNNSLAQMNHTYYMTLDDGFSPIQQSDDIVISVNAEPNTAPEVTDIILAFLGGYNEDGLDLTSYGVVGLDGVINNVGLQSTATDAEGDSFTYQWSDADNNEIDDATTYALTLSNVTAGDYQYSVTVTDSYNATDTETINFTIYSINQVTYCADTLSLNYVSSPNDTLDPPQLIPSTESNHATICGDSYGEAPVIDDSGSTSSITLSENSTLTTPVLYFSDTEANDCTGYSISYSSDVEVGSIVTLSFNQLDGTANVNPYCEVKVNVAAGEAVSGETGGSIGEVITITVMDVNGNSDTHTLNVTIFDDETYGCTDASALNYNSEADIDDGSCIYGLSIDAVYVDYNDGNGNQALDLDLANMETTMTPNEGSSVNITMIVSDAEGDPSFTSVNPTNGTISGGGTNASSDSNCTYTDYCISAGFAYQHDGSENDGSIELVFTQADESVTFTINADINKIDDNPNIFFYGMDDNPLPDNIQHSEDTVGSSFKIDIEDPDDGGTFTIQPSNNSLITSIIEQDGGTTYYGGGVATPVSYSGNNLGNSKTLAYYIAANAVGNSDITLTTFDASGNQTNSKSFNVEVTAVQDVAQIFVNDVEIDDLPNNAVSVVEESTPISNNISITAQDVDVGDFVILNSVSIDQQGMNHQITNNPDLLLGFNITDSAYEFIFTPDPSFEDGQVSINIQYFEQLIDGTVLGPIDTSFPILVTAFDDAPILTQPDDVSFGEDTGGTTVTLNATDIDNEDSSITFSAQLTNAAGEPFNAGYLETPSITGNILSINNTSNLSGNTQYITVTATSNGKTDSKTFKVTVTATDDISIISTIGTITIVEDSNETITITATDIDSIITDDDWTLPTDDDFTFDWVGFTYQEEGGDENQYKRDLIITPTTNYCGYKGISTSNGVKVTTNGQTSSRGFNVNVTCLDDATSISLTSTPDGEEEGVSYFNYDEDFGNQTLAFQLSDADVQNWGGELGTGQHRYQDISINVTSNNTDLITIPLSPPPGVNPSTGVVTIFFSSVDNQSGEATLTITATDPNDSGDGSLSDSINVLIKVGAVNDTPVVEQIIPQSFNQGTSGQINLDISDVEGDTIQDVAISTDDITYTEASAATDVTINGTTLTLYFTPNAAPTTAAISVNVTQTATVGSYPIYVKAKDFEYGDPMIFSLNIGDTYSGINSFAIDSFVTDLVENSTYTITAIIDVDTGIGAPTDLNSDFDFIATNEINVEVTGVEFGDFGSGRNVQITFNTADIPYGENESSGFSLEIFDARDADDDGVLDYPDFNASDSFSFTNLYVDCVGTPGGLLIDDACGDCDGSCEEFEGGYIACSDIGGGLADCAGVCGGNATGFQRGDAGADYLTNPHDYFVANPNSITTNWDVNEGIWIQHLENYIQQVINLSWDTFSNNANQNYLYYNGGISNDTFQCCPAGTAVVTCCVDYTGEGTCDNLEYNYYLEFTSGAGDETITMTNNDGLLKFCGSCPAGDEWIESIVADIEGCTNPLALNYNAEANVDDGTCSFFSGYVGFESAPAFGISENSYNIYPRGNDTRNQVENSTVVNLGVNAYIDTVNHTNINKNGFIHPNRTDAEGNIYDKTPDWYVLNWMNDNNFTGDNASYDYLGAYYNISWYVPYENLTQFVDPNSEKMNYFHGFSIPRESALGNGENSYRVNGGWQNNKYLVFEYGIEKYELTIFKREEGDTDLDEGTQYFFKQFLYTDINSDNDINTYEHFSGYQQQLDDGEITHEEWRILSKINSTFLWLQQGFDSNTVTDNLPYVSEFEQFVKGNYVYYFENPGEYRIKIQAYDSDGEDNMISYYPPKDENNQHTGWVNVDSSDIIQSLSNSYLPYQGIHIESYLNGTTFGDDVEPCNIDETRWDDLDIDDRKPLGCFNYENDNLLQMDWVFDDNEDFEQIPDFITTVGGDGPGDPVMENKIIIDELKIPHIVDVDVRMYKRRGLSQSTLFYYWDKDIHPNNYDETVAPLDVQFYFYPRPSKDDGGDYHLFEDKPITEEMLNDFKNGYYYLSRVNWGDGSDMEYDDEPLKLGFDVIAKHNYKRAGIYEITGHMLRVELSEDAKTPSGTISNTKFLVRININPEREDEFEYLGGTGYSFIPYQDTTPVIGGISKNSLYYTSISRQLGFIPEFDSQVQTYFEKYTDRLNSENALYLTNENQITTEIQNYQLPIYDKTNDVGNFDDTIPETNDNLIFNGLYNKAGELGSSIGFTDIQLPRFFKGVKPIWEMLGFQDNVAGKPDELRYWKNIIPKDYDIYNDRYGYSSDFALLIIIALRKILSINEIPQIEQQLIDANICESSGCDEYWLNVIDEALTLNVDDYNLDYNNDGFEDLLDINILIQNRVDNLNTWVGDYYYPVLPNRFDTSGALQNNNIPFGTPGRMWNEDDVEAPITNEQYQDDSLLLNYTSEYIGKGVLEDTSGYDNVGLCMNDYRLEYDNQTIEPIKRNRKFKLIRGKVNKAF